MKKWFPVTCGLAVALMASTLCLAADATATFVRGTIQKIDGNTVTVDGTAVTISDSTDVIVDKKHEKTDALAVGENITARIEGGTAVRIEVHADKK